MRRASYQARISVDTSAMQLRLAAAVSALAGLEATRREAIAGTIGSLIDGRGADGIFLTVNVGGVPTIVWGARMDEALKALAAGRVDQAEALLSALRGTDPRTRIPGEGLFPALEGLLAGLDEVRGMAAAPVAVLQNNPARRGTGS